MPLKLVDTHGPVAIVVPTQETSPEAFAAEELARYLTQITGSPFVVTHKAMQNQAALLVGRTLAEHHGIQFPEARFGADGFLMRREGKQIFLAGVSPRGTLYAAYAFLETLGCRWFAPNFSFYGPATGELVPHIPSPSIESLDSLQKPSFPNRILNIEEGESHTPENLALLIDWMAKAHLNTLNFPFDYEHRGHTEWEKFRSTTIPELQKRGMMLQVGGHGYPNFLPQDTYFATHPEWFGMIHGERTNAPNVVFSTANPQAVATFIANVIAYLRSHPEIDVFDCEPPDMTVWSEAPEDIALGDPPDRQMLLLNQLAAAVKKELPHVRVQFNAYSNFIDPPAHVRPDPSLQMFFSPYDRSFETSLFDPQRPENAAYIKDLHAWLDGLMQPEQINIYSYITKYVWRSLPITIPHEITSEIQQYSRMHLGGLSTYSEPAPWATFELDHYITSRALWNADLDVDAELKDYTTSRYGAAAPPVSQYFALLEAIVSHAIAMLGTNLDTVKEKAYIEQFKASTKLLEEARQDAKGEPGLLTMIDKLERTRRYTENEMELRLAFRVAGSAWRKGEMTTIENLLKEREQIIGENRDKGVLLIDQRIQYP